jgi:hypothetical protein
MPARTSTTAPIAPCGRSGSSVEVMNA